MTWPKWRHSRISYLRLVDAGVRADLGAPSQLPDGRREGRGPPVHAQHAAVDEDQRHAPAWCGIGVSGFRIFGPVPSVIWCFDWGEAALYAEGQQDI